MLIQVKYGLNLEGVGVEGLHLHITSTLVKHQKKKIAPMWDKIDIYSVFSV